TLPFVRSLTASMTELYKSQTLDFTDAVKTAGGESAQCISVWLCQYRTSLKFEVSPVVCTALINLLSRYERYDAAITILENMKSKVGVIPNPISFPFLLSSI